MMVRRLFPVLLGSLLVVACGDEDPVFTPGTTADAGGGGGATCVAGSTQLCACTSGETGAQVCESDGSAYSACDCTSGADIGGVILSVTDADTNDAIGLVTTHTIGETPCEQTLGTITLENSSDAAAEITIATGESLPQIVFDPASPVSVDAGTTATVSVTFDCNLLPSFPPDDISTFVTVGGGGTSLEFPLQLTFFGE